MKDKEREEQKKRLYLTLIEYCKEMRYTKEEIRKFFEMMHKRFQK